MSKKNRKKKARITNRQAKIRQKRKKPDKKLNTKYERLQRKVESGFKQKGISTKSIEFRESPDGVKMSAVLITNQKQSFDTTHPFRINLVTCLNNPYL